MPSKTPVSQAIPATPPPDKTSAPLVMNRLYDYTETRASRG
jgi:hypothetical protein